MVTITGHHYPTLPNSAVDVYVASGDSQTGIPVNASGSWSVTLKVENPWIQGVNETGIDAWWGICDQHAVFRFTS